MTDHDEASAHGPGEAAHNAYVIQVAAHDAYLAAWAEYERIDAEAQSDHDSKTVEEIEAGAAKAIDARDEAMRLRQEWWATQAAVAEAEAQEEDSGE